MMLQDSVIGKLINRMWDMTRDEIYEYIRCNGLGISDVKELPTMETTVAALMAGNAIMFIDGYDKAIKISSKGYPNMGVPKAESEKVLRGSKEGFAEAEKVNTALIRKRIRDPRLKVKEQPIGQRSNTMVALVYMDDLVYPSLLENITAVSYTHLDVYKRQLLYLQSTKRWRPVSPCLPLTSTRRTATDYSA